MMELISTMHNTWDDITAQAEKTKSNYLQSG